MNRRKLLGLLVASPVAAMLPAPVMASGGFVSAKGPFIVGERATEFFIETAKITDLSVETIWIRPQYPWSDNPSLP